MILAGDWLAHPGTRALMAALADGGARALFVGGCVRDAVMGRPVGDIDIATDALPGRVIDLATAAGLHVVPTGIDHGTVTVIADHRPHEVTTFRSDLATDGRRATVGFSAGIDADAARRDFTMNALYATPAGEVLDPLGSGLADAVARRIRFVGDPETRIREDYLRILRFFRFQATLGDPAEGPDAEGLAACAALAGGMDRLSRERVGQEMRKLLAAPDPAPAVATMAQACILPHVLPGARAEALAPLVHVEAGTAPDWLARLAVLGGDDPAAALRLSRVEERSLAGIRRGATLPDTPAALGWRLGAGPGRAAVLVRAALAGTPPEPGWQDEVARGAAARFPVRAADLPALSGPELGARLAQLQDRWLASNLRLGRENLLG